MTHDQHATNRLADESSLYLRQHANNPVDWYPWGPEALQRAKELDRPIFLSIGYSACHWCHVMAHECFEDPKIGKMLNDHFVSIKVDREERPDVDQIYMTAVQALNQGQGGWPMSVFLTPDMEPFFAGTYFPPDSRHGRPSFPLVLTRIAEAWETRREEVRGSGRQIAEVIRTHDLPTGHAGQPTKALLEHALTQLRRNFDPIHGGLGQAPKFPRPIDLRLLLRIHRRLGASDALSMVRLTLDKMALGGMYDQLGGGFHRYSTDSRWLVPHFEKMLYDNALLAPAYLEAWQVTGEPFYRQIVEETLDYVLREMTSESGSFYSTQDADSEGQEGKFYVWGEAEIVSILGKETAETFNYVFDVTAAGNWEGTNILNCPKTLEQNSKMLRMDIASLRTTLADAKRKLYDARSKRIWPGRDEKILTSWNALAISAFAQAGALFEEPRYLNASERAAEFILKHLRTSNGRLLRTASADGNGKLNAYLEDYAYVVDAFVTLYGATFEPRWLAEATRLAEVMIEQFRDEKEGGFFSTSRDHEALIARPKEVLDSSIPSGNAVAAMGLLRLATLTGRDDFRQAGEATLVACHGLMEQSPISCGQLLLAVDYYLGPSQEFAVIGSLKDPETTRVLRAIRHPFQPNSVVALRSPDGDDGGIAVLKDRTAHGGVTTYICQNFACQAPLVGAEALEKTLELARDRIEK
jgi:uncharacterized protein YyaL (SSP411 family)